MMATAISNSVDKVHYEEREEQYMAVVRKYTQQEAELLKMAYILLVDVLHEEQVKYGPTDVLGEIFHALELHNRYKGQFFTPMSIAKLMAAVTSKDYYKQVISKNGFMTVYEPTCGAGAMLLGFAGEAEKSNINYSREVCIFAQDIDLKCVHMCYIQLSLYGLPAVIQHGDTLAVESRSRWYTPIYMVDNWIWRAKMTATTGRDIDDEKIKCWLHPMYGIMKYGFSEEASGRPDTKNTFDVSLSSEADGQLLFDF